MRRNHIAILMIALAVIVVPAMAQSTIFPLDNRSDFDNAWFPNNLNPHANLDLSLDVNYGYLTWTRWDFYQSHWRIDNGSLILLKRWPNQTHGPSWGIFSRNIYTPTNKPDNRLALWIGPFIGNRNFQLGLMTNLDHSHSRRYGAFVAIRY